MDNEINDPIIPKVGESHEREIRLYDDRFGRRGRRR